MNISDAISKILKLDNYENLSNSQIYSMLSDYGVFKEYPNLRLVVKNALEYDFWKLLKNGVKYNEIYLLKTKLTNDGFNEKVVEEIINCLLSLDSNDHKSDCFYSIYDPKFDKRNVDSFSYDTHIKFWGISLGQRIDFIDKHIRKKGYYLSKAKSPKDLKTCYSASGTTEKFLGYGLVISVYASPYSNLVYKIEVYLSKRPINKIFIYNEIYPLLIKKYGSPSRDDNITKYGPQEGKGLFFNIQEGKISLYFGSYFDDQYSLYLKYEDRITFNKIKSEIDQFEIGIKSEKEIKQRRYQEKLLKDL